MSRKTNTGGVYDGGYGLIPKIPMRDKRLSPEAKAIYSYLSSFAGNSNRAYPHLNMILDEMGMSEKRFYKHRKQLLDYGYIEIEKHRDKNNSFTNNIYVICREIPQSQNDRMGNEAPHSQNDRMGENAETLDKSTFHEKKPHGRFDGAISNSSISNKVSSSTREVSLENIRDYYERNFGPFSPGEYNAVTKRLDAGFSEETIIKAYDIAIENRPRNRVSYINGIFKKWKDKKLFTLEVIEESEGKFRKKHKKHSNDDLIQSMEDITEEDIFGPGGV